MLLVSGEYSCYVRRLVTFNKSLRGVQSCKLVVAFLQSADAIDSQKTLLRKFPHLSFTDFIRKIAETDAF